MLGGSKVEPEQLKTERFKWGPNAEPELLETEILKYFGWFKVRFKWSIFFNLVVLNIFETVVTSKKENIKHFHFGMLGKTEILA